ncbi:MAG: amidohydrolase family protein [Betaproteobacteria bacterium]
MTTDIDRNALRAAELLLAPEYVMLKDGPVRDFGIVVANGRFRDVGPLAVIAQRTAMQPIAMPGKLIMPGFIDAHHHLTQSFGKALAFGEPSEIFRRIWVPLEGALDDEFVYLSAKLAALEALRGGFTTVCEAGTRAHGGADAVAAATRDAGLRCVLGLICNDQGGGGPPLDRDAILRTADAHLGRFGSDGIVHPSLAISIPEAASDEMLRAVYARCAESGAIFQTHVNEHLAAVERSLVERGMRPLELLHHVGALGPQTLVAHATLVTAHELDILRATDTAVSYNPVASQWKGNAVANATLMAMLGIRFGIGTDGTRSDGFRMIDAAEATQKLAFGLAQGDASSGGGWMWLDHATCDGADAAGLGAITGEIAAAKAADFLVVDIDVPEMHPSFDLTWELVRLANRDQIVAVFVAGTMRLWEGWPVDWDGRALMRQVAATAQVAVAQAPIRKIHRHSTEHRAQARKLT